MKRKTILITGATGFLGGYIARELLEAGLCLKFLVRKFPHIPAQERLSDIFSAFGGAEFTAAMPSNHTEIIEGDVSRIYLGLTPREYFKLSDTVDEVIHCAAATKFDNNADDVLTQTNVLGTEFIALFCGMKNPKRLHYVSTAYVAGKRRGTVFENELENGQSFNNNYERSKYEAERLLFGLIRQYQIPCTVYRPSIIVGDAATGYTKNYDNIYVFGKGLSRSVSGKMRNGQGKAGECAVEEVRNLSCIRIPGDKYGTVNLIPVDFTARAIAAISRMEEGIGSTVHIVNPSPPTLGELAEWMSIATGNYRVKIVPSQDFQSHPQTAQESRFLPGIQAFSPYMFGEPYFDSKNARNLLSGTGIECPLITQELINRFIQYALDTGWGRKKPETARVALDTAV